MITPCSVGERLAAPVCFSAGASPRPTVRILITIILVGRCLGAAVCFSGRRRRRPLPLGVGYHHARRAVPCSEPPKLDFARFGEPHALPPFAFSGRRGRRPLPLGVGYHHTRPALSSSSEAKDLAGHGLVWVTIILGRGRRLDDPHRK